ncbi:hypothetical protein Tco_0684727 [Tanacetum coccineum]
MKENTSKSKNLDPILEPWIRIKAYKKKLEHINVPWENILFNYCSSEFDTLEPERMKENRASEFQYKKLSKRASEMGHFARECRAPRSKEGQFRNQDNTWKQGNNEDTSSKAMLAIDGVGFD